MGEGGWRKNIGYEAAGMALNLLSRELEPSYKKGGFALTAEHALEKFNIRTEFSQAENPEFLAMRERLEKDPGLIISNHPAGKKGIDIPVILQAIKRPDLKIMVHDVVYQAMQRGWGSEQALPAKSGLKNIDEHLEMAGEHINQGGAFLIFPTGGKDGSQRPIKFRSGWRYILERLSPEKMIYSFFINPDDIDAALKNLGPAARLTGLLLPDVLNINKMKEPSTIKVDEHYGQAGEWQELIMGIKNSQLKNQTLTDHYKEIFGIEDKIAE